MINPKTLSSNDIHRMVIYKPTNEEGRLSSWNDRYVFVRFKGPSGEACRPVDVDFSHHWIDAAMGDTKHKETGL